MSTPLNTPEMKTLHAEWRGISAILKAVTAVNNAGHSTLIPTYGGAPHSLQEFNVNKDQIRVLNSIASLLVRTGEVVTVMPTDRELEFVIMAQNERGNPSQRDEYFNDSPDLLVKIVETSVSHWPRIFQLSLSDIFDPGKLRQVVTVTSGQLFTLQYSVPRDDPLENHIATIKEFINQYRLKREDRERNDMFWKFSAYLSSVSWRRTYRRLRNWTSQGFIYALIAIPLSSVAERAKERSFNPNSKHSNRALLSEVSGLCRKEGAVQALVGPLISMQIPIPSNLNNLLQALQMEMSNPNCSAYNETSCIEFHFLLLAILVQYVKALKDHWISSAGKPAHSHASLDRVWKFGRFFWTLTSSRMFDDHLQAMRTLFSPVSFHTRGTYAKFFNCLGLNNPDGLLEGSGWGKGKRNSSRGGDEGGNGEEDVEVDVEEEQRIGTPLDSSSDDNVFRFQNWTRIINSYFAALRRLTLAAKNRDKPFETKFIVANPLGDCGSISTADWSDIIMNLCNLPALPDAPSFSKEEALNAIERVRMRCNLGSPSVVNWTGTPHCEAVAVALFSFLDEVLGEDQSDIRQLILVRL